MASPTLDNSTFKNIAYGVGTGGAFKFKRVADIFIPLSAVAIGVEATIWTPAATRYIRLLGGCVSYGVAAGDVTLRSNTGGTTIAVLPNAPLATPFSFTFGELGVATTFITVPLTAQGVATQTISGYLYGMEELSGQ